VALHDGRVKLVSGGDAFALYVLRCPRRPVLNAVRRWSGETGGGHNAFYLYTPIISFTFSSRGSTVKVPERFYLSFTKVIMVGDG
jgi:hypothetical protein